MKRLTFVLILIGLVTGCGAEDQAALEPNRGFQVQAAFVTACPEIEVDLVSCRNHPGSEIILTGSVTWDELAVQIISQNNAKGTHKRTDVIATFVLIEAGEIVFDKEPVKGGVGGNPHLSAQLVTGDGTPVGALIDLGRCVQDGK